MNLDMQKYKKILEDKLKRLEGEIIELSEKEGDSTWVGIQTEVGEDTADEGEIADSIENYKINSSITSDLERGIIDIKDALEKIESGKYGVCEICMGEIEEERLTVEPEARTCKLHV